MQSLLYLTGLWAPVNGLVNIDGNPSIFLHYASFSTGIVAISGYTLSKER